jgi:hypothetical protein
MTYTFDELRDIALLSVAFILVLIYYVTRDTSVFVCSMVQLMLPISLGIFVVLLFLDDVEFGNKKMILSAFGILFFATIATIINSC